jgi:hypothetical protein
LVRTVVRTVCPQCGFFWRNILSRENIVSIVPSRGGCVVTFKTRSGENIAYEYGAAEAVAIMAGEDPGGFSGERVDLSTALLKTAIDLLL